MALHISLRTKLGRFRNFEDENVRFFNPGRKRAFADSLMMYLAIPQKLFKQSDYWT
jgi:hypothetical protein